jgi:hypothetical protein
MVQPAKNWMRNNVSELLDRARAGNTRALFSGCLTRRMGDATVRQCDRDGTFRGLADRGYATMCGVMRGCPCRARAGTCLLKVCKSRMSLCFCQPFVQLRPPAPSRHVAHSDRYRLLLADQHDQSLSSGHPGVEQVPLQHGVVLRQNRDNDGGILRALAFVNCRGIGRNQRRRSPSATDRGPCPRPSWSWSGHASRRADRL